VRRSKRYHLRGLAGKTARLKEQRKEGASIFARLLDVPFDTLEIGLPLRFRPLVTEGQTSVAFAP
jgi:hypothetical protein